MHKGFIYILFVAALVSSCGSQKGIVKSDASVSKLDYPYIEAFHSGMKFKIEGRVDEAILEFEKCLKIKKDDDAVYFALSKLELERGNMDKSAEYIQLANQIDPGNTWYIEELAYMYFERDEYPKAAENFAKLVKIEPRNLDWMFGYSEALLKNNQPKEALKVFDQMEGQIGKHPHFYLQRFNILIQMNQVAAAEKELLKGKDAFPHDPGILGSLIDFYFTINQNEKAEKMLEELVIADPMNGRAHLALADIYQRRNDMEKVYKALEMAMASEDVDIDTKMGVLINIQGQHSEIPEQMIPILNAFVAMYSDNAKAYSIQGDYLLQMDQSEEALVAYKKANALDNSLFPIWNQILILEYQSEAYDSLYVDSKACLELFPTMGSVYLMLGVSANQLGKYEEAYEALSLGSEMIFNDPLMKAEFYGQLGEAHFGLKEYDEGISNYKKAIAIDQQSSLLKNNFARHLASAKKELDLAISLTEQVTNAYPNNDVFLDTRGWVYFQKGDYESAKQWFKKAVGANPESAVALEHYGDAMYKLNNTAEALEYWQKAIANGGSSDGLKKKIANKKYYEPNE